jgi:hypothetical protein
VDQDFPGGPLVHGCHLLRVVLFGILLITSCPSRECGISTYPQGLLDVRHLKRVVAGFFKKNKFLDYL